MAKHEHHIDVTKEESYDCFSCGHNGKVVIIRIPVEKVVVNKKTKKKYDLKSVVDHLEPLRGKKVLFVQEKVSSMPGEGSVSAFSFGMSAGSTVGIAYALGFEVVMVGSTKWKSLFPELIDDEIRDCSYLMGRDPKLRSGEIIFT